MKQETAKVEKVESGEAVSPRTAGPKSAATAHVKPGSTPASLPAADIPRKNGVP